MKKRIWFIFILLLFASCNDKITFNIPPSYCGNVFIILTSDDEYKEIVSIDSSGIGYVSESQMIKDGKFSGVEIFEKNIDVTEQCINISEGFATGKNFNRQFHYINFYRNCSNEDIDLDMFKTQSELQDLIDRDLLKF